jgi:methenyltetrahydromethanopterin cyclohydrolase
MESLNRMAVELVDEALDFAGELGVAVHELDCGATVLDFGVEATGGLEAGLLLAEIQTAGLATVGVAAGEVAGHPRPHVELTTDRPALACLCSQKAGWELDADGFEGLGSGPARALVGEEAEFEAVGYYDEFDLTALAVESTSLPTDAVASRIAERAGVEPTALYLPTYATGSLAGSVVTAARAVELAVFRLFELGYDPTDVLSGVGEAPVAPVSHDETVAVGRTDDALAHGGRVHLAVRTDDDALTAVPSTAAETFGEPFATRFDRPDATIGDAPTSVFAPAAVTADVVDGPVRAAGRRRESYLAESFGLPAPDA